MNYKKHYEKLIERAKSRKLDCYKEVHHIIPKSMGGTNDKDNLVELTAREHFIAHLLLVKIHSDSYSMIKALNMMCVSSDNQERSMNRMYGWLREKFSETQSKSQSGEGNSQYGSRWISNELIKESKKIPKTEPIENGWVKGRNTWIKKEKEIVKKQKLDEKKRAKELKEKEETYIIFRKYLESDYDSLNKFAVENFDKSLVILTKRFKKYIDGYNDVSLQGAQNIKEKLKQLKKGSEPIKR